MPTGIHYICYTCPKQPQMARQVPMTAFTFTLFGIDYHRKDYQMLPSGFRACLQVSDGTPHKPLSLGF